MSRVSALQIRIAPVRISVYKPYLHNIRGNVGYFILETGWAPLLPGSFLYRDNTAGLSYYYNKNNNGYFTKITLFTRKLNFRKKNYSNFDSNLPTLNLTNIATCNLVTSHNAILCPGSSEITAWMAPNNEIRKVV